jgi:transcriptional regulator with XRE-family HTH domain
VPERRPNYELVSERLRRARKQRNLSLRQVADAIDVSPSTLSRVERGAQPDIETVNKLIDWLELDRNAVFHSAPKEAKDTAKQVEVLLRADKNLDPRTARALSSIFKTAYREMTSG